MCLPAPDGLSRFFCYKFWLLYTGYRLNISAYQNKKLMESIFKPAWSRQHGAYITLITSWLIGTLLSRQFYAIHFVILLMLLSGFNFTEFMQDRFLRNSPPSQRKKIWTWIYLTLAVLSGVCVLINVTEFKFILPFFIAAGLIFLLLTKLRLHKNIFSEFLTFAVLSLGGLIAYNPHIQSQFMVMFPLWVLMFFYFSSTIFLVKIRFNRIKITEVFIYLLISCVILFYVWGNVLIVWLVSGLIALRILPLVFMQDWFKKLRITTIGFIETGFQVLFLASILLGLK